MSRPRKDNIRTTVSLDGDTYSQLEMILLDPVKGKLMYGALSQLVTVLIKQWLKSFQKQEDRVAFLRAYGIEVGMEKEKN